MTKNLDRVVPGIELSSTSFATERLDSSRWAFINGWKVEPQATDRSPASGVVVRGVASASAARSMTRRKQQVMFKKWSQDRSE